MSAPALGGQRARLRGREHGERAVGAVVRRPVEGRPAARDLGVALAPAEEQGERRALVWWKLVQSAHGLCGLRWPSRVGGGGLRADVGYRGAR